MEEMDVFSYDIVYVSNDNYTPTLKEVEFQFAEYLYIKGLPVLPHTRPATRSKKMSKHTLFLGKLIIGQTRFRKISHMPREIRNLAVNVEKSGEGTWLVSIYADLVVTGKPNYSIERITQVVYDPEHVSKPIFSIDVLQCEVLKDTLSSREFAFSRVKSNLVLAHNLSNLYVGGLPGLGKKN